MKIHADAIFSHLEKIGIGVSGGKDSTALLIWAIENFPNSKIYPIFADTGWEHPDTYEYLKYLENKLSINIYRVKSDKYNGMLDLIRKKKIFPSMQRRICTYELKIKPIKKFLQTNNIDIYLIGIRRKESTSREKKFAEFEADKDYPMYYLSHEYPTSFHTRFRLPLLEWTKEDVLEYLHNHGIKANPLYEKGFVRVGCFPCLLSMKDIKLASTDPIGKERIKLLLALAEELNDGIANRKNAIRIHPDKDSNQRIYGFLIQHDLFSFQEEVIRK